MRFPARIRALAVAAVVGLAVVPAAARAQDVNPEIDIAPANPVGTVLMIHQGGWAGPDRAKQEALMTWPGQVFIDRHWRTVSVDYAAGKDGLQSVLDAIGNELVHPASDGPLCLYGESAGAQFALLAAARLASVSCVIAFGAPTDFQAMRDEVVDSGNPVAQAEYDAHVVGTFGEPGASTAAWEPAKVASKINADVLLVRQGDDGIVPAQQQTILADALPIVQTLVTAVGNLADPSQKYMHGTLSDEARAAFAGAIGAFADRAVANGRTAAWARQQGCRQANGAYGRIGARAFRTAVACLVNNARQEAGGRKVAAAARLSGGRTIAVSVVGQVTPARVAAALQASAHKLRRVTRTSARRIAVSVAQAAKSTVTLTLR